MLDVKNKIHFTYTPYTHLAFMDVAIGCYGPPMCSVGMLCRQSRMAYSPCTLR
eukprot:NODE_5097_length_296_cov_34.619433_g5014_i0.p2 GENE.NODE_5097_length_296_cov_34.619433_g5014_i0~~NODE_5097_length_296_cov_34.619433_g5014_i0.p2  ORF type:complete len:53 (+),score=5.81 NODE_5097_length_296_cov_34.619433_g5014_i0:134-292(+)